MFKKIFRGVRNAIKSPAGMLGLGALALGPLGGGAALSSLFGSGAMKGALGKYGIPALLGLITSGALKGEEKEEAVSFDDFESQTTKKYGDKFGGSPFRGEQFLDLMFEPGSAKYFDYRNPQGQLADYQFDSDDRIIERKKGGIANLYRGGTESSISDLMMNPEDFMPSASIPAMLSGFEGLQSIDIEDLLKALSRRRNRKRTLDEIAEERSDALDTNEKISEGYEKLIEQILKDKLGGEFNKGGVAKLNMGGNPFMDRQRISGSMGGGMNPGGYSPDPTIKSITGYNPLRAAQGSDVSVESVQAQMNNNPVGIAQYFPRKFGMINGPGGPKEDKIPAMLSDGEFVFTAKAVDNAGGPKAMYNMMNKLDPESSKGRGIMS